MAREMADLYVYDDVMQRCDRVLQNNFMKFQNCAKLKEIFRLKFIETNNRFKFLKTWLDTACVDIITLKSECKDLIRLYEALLKNNFVKDFLDYANDQETLQVKLIEVMNECKNLESKLNVINKEVVSLKSEHNSLNRNYEGLLKNDFTKLWLKHHSNQRETLRLRFMKSVEECERLCSCLNAAYENIVNLNSKHDDLMRRFTILSQNDIIEEFLEYANREETLKLEISKQTNACKCIKARAMLNKEKLQREEVENERDALDYLSEGLCRLLLRYQRRDKKGQYDTTSESIQHCISSAYTPAKNSNVVVEVDSSSDSESKVDIEEINIGNNLETGHQLWLNESDDEPSIVKQETPDELPDTLPAYANELVEFLDFHSSLPVKKCNELSSISSNHKKRTLPPIDPLEITPKTKSPIVARNLPENNDNSGLFCDICCRYYMTRGGLRRHKNVIHGGPKPFGCATCGKRFIEKSYLQRHELLHSSTRPYKCSFCSKCYKDPSNKRRHERSVHEADRRFECAHCDHAPFVRKERLVNHIEVNHLPQLKKFECPICGKPFALKEYLKDHVMTHTSEKLFKCSMCYLHFKDKKTRRKHERAIHIKNARFYCAHCVCRYRYKYDLSRHMQKKHLPVTKSTDSE